MKQAKRDAAHAFPWRAIDSRLFPRKPSIHRLGRSSDLLSAARPSHAPMAAHSGSPSRGAAASLSSQQRDCPGFAPDSLLTPILFWLRTLTGALPEHSGDQIRCKSTNYFLSANIFLFTPCLYVSCIARPQAFRCDVCSNSKKNMYICSVARKCGNSVNALLLCVLRRGGGQ